MNMAIPSIHSITTLIVLFAALAFADEHQDFLECLNEEFKNNINDSISNVVYTPENSSYPSILRFSIRNLRFETESTPKPLAIITPEHESQVPPVILCAKKSHDLQIRIRSGGHDFEGTSYVSQSVPFLLLDMINLSETIVNVEEKTAWVGVGSNVGSLYYRIAEKSQTLAFPAGIATTVGVGGQFGGGGYGLLLRKYGLAADNIIDARVVDVNGRILDRKTMGEDLCWAIRGGVAANFVVVLAWKLQLVDVPETVTVFAIDKTLEQNATHLIHRWQSVAPKLDRDLYISIMIRRSNSTTLATFYSLFLGRTDELIALMQENFHEFGPVRENCIETSWINATLYHATGGMWPLGPLEALLNQTQPMKMNVKIKSDYVQTPIPEYAFETIWRMLSEPDAPYTEIYAIPYGGRMSEISESSIPFPHRAGVLYKFSPTAYWGNEEAAGNDSDTYIRWIRRVHRYLTPFVSKSPRQTYVNYRDLDIGVNNIRGETSYAQASVWGFKYFKNNFDRLVRVKTAVDPKNFFRNEQSIPPLPSKWTKKDD